MSALTSSNELLARRAWVAYLRQELTAPAAALAQYTHDLSSIIATLNDDYLTQATERMANRAKHLQMTIQQLVEAPTSESELDYQRGVRHDLRAAASYLVSASDDIAESVAEDRRGEIATPLAETRTAAHRIIDSIEELLQFNEVSATLPAADGNLVAEMLERLPKLMDRTQPHIQPLESSRILIVDDNEFGRDLLARMLSQQGHAVEVVSSAMEAQYRLQDRTATSIDLILLDVLMPGMSGPELLHWLKREPSFWHLPVIMVSALGEDDSVLACIAAGAEDYLTRPVRAELLRARITGCLEKKRLRDREAEYQARIAGLIRAIFPPAVVQEWESTGTIRPKNHECVGVLFTDVVGFTSLCERHRDQPEQVVELLQQQVEKFEETLTRHGVQKIKTMGDGFMCVAGINEDDACPARTLLRCGLDMIADTHSHPAGWQVRIGIHIGPVVTGVLGKRQFSFDLWGHTVNAAARIEANGTPDKVTLSQEAWASLNDTARGESRSIDARGIGVMEVWDFKEWEG